MVAVVSYVTPQIEATSKLGELLKAKIDAYNEKLQPYFSYKSYDLNAHYPEVPFEDYFPSVHKATIT